MIHKINKYEYECDYCNKKTEFYNGYLNHIEKARNDGWAVSKNRTRCFCPNCAIYFRNTGKMTERKMWELKHPKEKNI